MTANYVKHDREISQEHMLKYGKFATHDLHVPILLLYEAGKINDKNGTEVDINSDFINHTLKATNNWIKKRQNNIFAKAKSWWNKSTEEVEAIPIIKNHDTDNVDNIVGHIRGYLYTEIVENKLSLKGLAVIKDPEAKQRIENDLLRNTSIGTRGDGSIKEVSLVVNEALAHGGFEMSEHSIVENISENKPKKINKKLVQLQEQMHNLQLQEKELSQKIIPNHIILAKMIKNGGIEPWKYDDLIIQDTATLQLMEKSMPKVNLGIMYGTFKQPKKIDMSESIIQETIDKFKKTASTTNKKENKKLSTQDVEMIMQNHSFEEARNKELLHILKLSEYSPEIVKNYIAIELGNNLEVKQYEDKYLSEYLDQQIQLQKQINNLTIQLGEYSE